MANIKQIAKMAGVSVSTVSRVLNNYAHVHEDKRKAVLAAVEQLNYSRNMNAIHLIKGKTNMIGIMLPYHNHAYFSRLVEGIANAALPANVQLMLCQTNYNPDEERKTLNMLKMKQIDGIIICSRTMSWAEIEPYAAFGPIVACADVASPAISTIYHDYYGSFRMALDYLIAKGHRRLGYSIGRPDSDSSLIRRQAYVDALASINESCREEWMFTKCIAIENGVDIVHRILAMDERPTALLVTGDHVAAGIMTEARKHGIRIPEDLAIIGFDNQPIGKVFDLTTVDNRLADMGSTAFRIVHEQVTNPKSTPQKREMDFRLIERSTV